MTPLCNTRRSWRCSSWRARPTLLVFLKEVKKRAEESIKNIEASAKLLQAHKEVRDAKIVDLKAEITRKCTLIKELEQRVAWLEHGFKHAVKRSEESKGVHSDLTKANKELAEQYETIKSLQDAFDQARANTEVLRFFAFCNSASGAGGGEEEAQG